jgi:transposase
MAPLRHHLIALFDSSATAPHTCGMDDEIPPAGITVEEWATTPPSVRQFIGAMLTVLAQQQQQLAQLQARLVDLEARLNQHSQNSSKPPSSDPPSAPPRPTRTPRGRSKGAQPGHPRYERPDPDPTQIDSLLDHHPPVCPNCHDALPATLRDACAVRVQYVWDVPIVRPHITAHHYHTVCCPGCRELVTATRPADVPPGSFGPRTAATVAMLHGRYRISDREIPQLLQDLYGLPISLGSVVELQQVVSGAMAPIYTAIQTTIQQQPTINMDETGWKEAGKRRWLWVAVSRVATLFHVASSRAGKVIATLVGTPFGGVVTSDRLKSYRALPLDRRQVCWAHLIRNLLALAERNGRLGVWAADLLAQTELLFALWHAFRAGRIDRVMLTACMQPLQATIRVLLERGQRRYDQAQGLSEELLSLWPALWTFVSVDGVEPTNNAAEQALRPAVLWRKGCFGAQSAAGNTFVERILTVAATCRQQERHLLTFLTEAVDAYWQGQPAPTLV